MSDLETRKKLQELIDKRDENKAKRLLKPDRRKLLEEITKAKERHEKRVKEEESDRIKRRAELKQAERDRRKSKFDLTRRVVLPSVRGDEGSDNTGVLESGDKDGSTGGDVSPEQGTDKVTSEPTKTVKRIRGPARKKKTVRRKLVKKEEK